MTDFLQKSYPPPTACYDQLKKGQIDVMEYHYRIGWNTEM